MTNSSEHNLDPRNILDKPSIDVYTSTPLTLGKVI